MYVCTPECMYRRGVDLLELELHMLVSHHVGTGN